MRQWLRRDVTSQVRPGAKEVDIRSIRAVKYRHDYLIAILGARKTNKDPPFHPDPAGSSTREVKDRCT